jgi:hypothetical protein
MAEGEFCGQTADARATNAESRVALSADSIVFHWLSLVPVPKRSLPQAGLTRAADRCDRSSRRVCRHCSGTSDAQTTQSAPRRGLAGCLGCPNCSDPFKVAPFQIGPMALSCATAREATLLPGKAVPRDRRPISSQSHGDRDSNSAPSVASSRARACAALFEETANLSWNAREARSPLDGESAPVVRGVRTPVKAQQRGRAKPVLTKQPERD